MSFINHFVEDAEIKSVLIFGKESEKKVDISIVIPTYKRIDLLRKNLKAILEQEKMDNSISYEVVVVANDPEFELKKLNLSLDPRIFKIYVNSANLGMCGNMNRCALLAHGEYISYIQDDDVLLPNYLNAIGRLIQTGELKNIDWLIPNRYYLMPDNEIQSQFGGKAIRNMKIKRHMGTILRLGKPIPKFQRIMPYETVITTYPFYAGGPTCGMLFKRVSLIESAGFDPNFPYGFDYLFFIEFAEDNNVTLYNEYLSLYMTSESASNRPEVQFDFFRARYNALDKNYKKYGISAKLKDIITYITYSGYPLATKKMIDREYSIKTKPVIACQLYLLWARLKTYKSGGYRRRECPKSVYDWYMRL